MKLHSVNDVGYIPKPPPFQIVSNKADDQNLNNSYNKIKNNSNIHKSNNNNDNNNGRNYNNSHIGDSKSDIKTNDINNDNSLLNSQTIIQTTATIHATKPSTGNVKFNSYLIM